MMVNQAQSFSKGKRCSTLTCSLLLLSVRIPRSLGTVRSVVRRMLIICLDVVCAVSAEADNDFNDFLEECDYVPYCVCGKEEPLKCRAEVCEAEWIPVLYVDPKWPNKEE